MEIDPCVHIVDDDAAMRDSLHFLVSAHELRAATYASGDAFLSAASPAMRGCLVTDVRMPGLSGIELIRRLAEGGIQLPVIVITGHGDVPLAVEAMKSGAIDFIEKPFDDAVMMSAIDMALKLAGRGVAATAPSQGERALIRERIASLTPRELDVLNGLVAGNPNKTIARDLGISPRTVEIYRANLMHKLEARALADLIRMAILAGSLPPDR